VIVKIADLRSKLEEVTARNGISEKDARDYIAAIIAHYEEDNFFKGFKGVHGVTDWITQLETMNSKEQVLFESDSVLHLDGLGKQPFYIVMQRFNEICDRAAQNGSFTVAIKGEYMSALFYVVRKFANNGYLAILASNGGPQGTIPHGGKTDIFGTNPLAYGIPSSTDPIVFDAATYQSPDGNFNIRELPEH